MSGRGVPAALLTAKFSAEVRFTLAVESDPSAAMNRLNAIFCATGWDDRFMTMCVAVIDLATHEVRLVNAGHMAPFLRHADRRTVAVSAADAGVPIGVSPDFQYASCSLKLAAGDGLFMFTDGLSEAMNMDNELYGLERIEATLRSEAGGVRQLGEQILADVKRFVGRRSQSDDICLLCFGRI